MAYCSHWPNNKRLPLTDIPILSRLTDNSIYFSLSTLKRIPLWWTLLEDKKELNTSQHLPIHKPACSISSQWSCAASVTPWLPTPMLEMWWDALVSHHTSWHSCRRRDVTEVLMSHFWRHLIPQLRKANLLTSSTDSIFSIYVCKMCHHFDAISFSGVITSAGSMYGTSVGFCLKFECVSIYLCLWAMLYKNTSYLTHLTVWATPPSSLSTVSVGSLTNPCIHPGLNVYVQTCTYK